MTIRETVEIAALGAVLLLVLGLLIFAANQMAI